MDPFTILGIGSAVASGVQGYQKGKQADAMNKQALAQAEMEYQQRAPMRRQGMQALGQIEAPLDLGNIGFNAANPFAAARGPAESTASLGNWGRFTTSPDQVDMALSGVRPEELQFAQDAMAADYLGRSGGKQRFGGTGSGREYTNDDRNHAMNAINKKVQQNLGYAGITGDALMQRIGMQALGTSRPAAPRTAQPRRGILPIGGMR